MPDPIRLGHEHTILCVILDVGHSGKDVNVPECEPVDVVHEEIALIFESAQCSHLGLHVRQIET